MSTDPSSTNRTQTVQGHDTGAHHTGTANTDTDALETQQSTGITPESLKSTLEKQLHATFVQIEDMSGGCGQMFGAHIVSPQFEGKARLARHRLVNTTLKEEIKVIHAWTPKCYTPAEWQKELAKQ